MDPKSGTTCDCSDSAVVAVLDVVQAAFASFGRWNGPPFAPSIQAFQRQSCCASPSQSWQRDRRVRTPAVDVPVSNPQRGRTVWNQRDLLSLRAIHSVQREYLGESLSE